MCEEAFYRAISATELRRQYQLCYTVKSAINKQVVDSVDIITFVDGEIKCRQQFLEKRQYQLH